MCSSEAGSPADIVALKENPFMPECEKGFFMAGAICGLPSSTVDASDGLNACSHLHRC